jgi:hypothetical protein
MAITASVTTYQIQQRAFTSDIASAITVTGISGTTTVKANIYFVKTGKPIPQPTTSSGPVMVETYQPEASYLAWVDLLRNEKPLTMNINGTSFYVQSGQEAVGTHEVG